MFPLSSSTKRVDALSCTSVLERANLVGGCGCRNSQCWYTSLCFLSQSSRSLIPRGASITSWSCLSVSDGTSSASLRKKEKLIMQSTRFAFQKLQTCLVMAFETEQLLTLKPRRNKSQKLLRPRPHHAEGI